MQQLMKLVILTGMTTALLLGQCTAGYSDGSVDDSNTNLIAWAVATDYYGSTCTAPWSIGFTHTYQAQATIQSPSGRTGSNYSQSSQYGGGGSTQATAFLDIQEDGAYYLVENEQIDCTVAGTILLVSRSSPFFAVGRVRTTYGFYSTFGGCSYQKSCSPWTNHWAGDTFTSMPLNKPPDYSSCWNFVYYFHRFVKVGNLRRYWRITNDLGQSWVGYDGWLECDGPMP